VTWRTAITGALGCAALLSGAAVASAQSPSSSAAAEALFQEGVALSEKGQWRQACEKLAASEELDVAVGTLLRLGDCYERTGRTASAWASFQAARSLAQAQGMAERERLAKQRVDALEPKLARLTIVAPSITPPGLQVMSGEEPVPAASWGSSVPVDAGERVVEARAPGYVTFRRAVTIPATAGARVLVSIPALEPELVADVAAPAQAPTKRAVVPKKPPSSTDRGYAARATGITFAVVGGVGLLGAGGLALLSNKRNDQSLEHCPNGPKLCTSRGVQLREEALTLADMATVSAAVGGGLLATGLVVYVIGAKKKQTTERATLEVVPDVGLARLSLQARGSF
jgi:hypothetical protein